MQVALRRRLRLPLPLASRHCGGDRVWLRRPLGPLRGPRNRLPSHRPASPPCETRRAGLAPGCACSGRGWRPRHRPATPWGTRTYRACLAPINADWTSSSMGLPPRGGALRGRHPGRAFEPARAAYYIHGSATRDGAALEAAERRKHRVYTELLRGGPQRLLVLGAETGGRWSRDCFSLAMCSGWQRRWWALLACAVQRAVAMSATSAPWASTPPTPATPPCPLAILSLAEFAGPSFGRETWTLQLKNVCPGKKNVHAGFLRALTEDVDLGPQSIAASKIASSENPPCVEWSRTARGRPPPFRWISMSIW